MPQLSSEVVEQLRHISRYPQMYASTPEEADGWIKGMGWMILANELDLSFSEASHTVNQLVKKVTSSVGAPDSIPVMLCQTSFPERRTSFDMFRQQSAKLIDLLEEFAQSRPPSPP